VTQKTEKSKKSAESTQPDVVGTIKIVPLGKLRPNPWNYNIQSDFMERKLGESVDEFGQVDPIIVRFAPDRSNFPDVPYEIIGGEHRWKAYKSRGVEKVRVLSLGKISEREAKKLCIALNEIKGEAQVDRLSELVTGLLAEDADDMSSLPFTSSEIETFQKMEDFSFDNFESSPDSDGSEVGGTQGGVYGNRRGRQAWYILGMDTIAVEDEIEFIEVFKSFKEKLGVSNRIKGFAVIQQALEYLMKKKSKKFSVDEESISENALMDDEEAEEIRDAEEEIEEEDE
jgi:ParB/Sulfiredoxin domain